MDNKEKLLAYAKTLYYDYVDVEYLGEWNGYTVYVPILGTFAVIGIPTYILEDEKGELSYTTAEESFDIMDKLIPPDYDEEDDEFETEEDEE